MVEKNKLSNRFKLNKNPKEKAIKAAVLDSDSLKLKFEQSELDNNDIPESIKYLELSDVEADFKRALLEKIDTIPVWFEYTKNRQKELIKSFVENKIVYDNINLTALDRDVLIDNLYASITDFGAIQYLLDNEKVNAVYVNGQKSVYIEIDGKILNTETKLSEKQINFLLHTLKVISGHEKFERITSFKTDSYSVKIINPDICEDGVNIVIRKLFSFDKETLLKNKMMTAEIFDFLVSIVDFKKNIVIAGGINSGKSVLTDVLVDSALKGNRTYLIEDDDEILANFDTLVKFKCKKDSEEYKNITSDIMKSLPDYVVTDVNSANALFSEAKGYICTLRASTLEFALKELIVMYMADGTPEKYAKTKALTNFDYIVMLDRTPQGTIVLNSIVELTNAKTMQLSLKTVAKLSGDSYVTEIPQPITSMRAEALISKNKPSKSRFRKAGYGTS